MKAIITSGRIRRAAAAATVVVTVACGLPASASPLAARATTLAVNVSGGGSYTAGASRAVLTDNGLSVTCTGEGRTPASDASGSIPSGSHSDESPVQVGAAAKLAFNDCSGPAGEVTARAESAPYAVSVDSATNGKGETDAIISGVKVAVSMTGCSFTVTGTVPGYYTNGKHTLTMTSQLPARATAPAELTASGVSGCAGLVKNGDHPGYASTYTLSSKAAITAAALVLQGTVTHGGKAAFHAAAAQLSAEGIKVTCANSGRPVVTGTTAIPSSARKGSPPLAIGTISAIRFGHCSAGHQEASIKADGLPYSVGIDSATSSKGKSDAIISGVDISVATHGCDFTVSGSAAGYYTNSTRTLTVTPNLPVSPADTSHLKVSNVQGCGSAASGSRPQIAPLIIVIVILIIGWDASCLYRWFHKH